MQAPNIHVRVTYSKFTVPMLCIYVAIRRPRVLIAHAHYASTLYHDLAQQQLSVHAQIPRFRT